MKHKSRIVACAMIVSGITLGLFAKPEVDEVIYEKTVDENKNVIQLVRKKIESPAPATNNASGALTVLDSYQCSFVLRDATGKFIRELCTFKLIDYGLGRTVLVPSKGNVPLMEVFDVSLENNIFVAVYVSQGTVYGAVVKLGEKDFSLLLENPSIIGNVTSIEAKAAKIEGEFKGNNLRVTLINEMGAPKKYELVEGKGTILRWKEVDGSMTQKNITTTTHKSNK